MPDAVDQKERRSEVTGMFARNNIHHTGSVGDCMEPIQPWHLLFREVSATHMDHSLPMGLNDIPLDDWRVAGVAMTFKLLSIRYSLIAVPNSLTLQLL